MVSDVFTSIFWFSPLPVLLFVSGNEIGFLCPAWPFGLPIYLNYVHFSRFLSKVWSYQIKKVYEEGMLLQFSILISGLYCHLITVLFVYLAVIVSFLFLFWFSLLHVILFIWSLILEFMFVVWNFNFIFAFFISGA